MNPVSGAPDSGAAERVAALLPQAHATGVQMSPAAESALAELPDVYRVQDIAVAALGKGQRAHA